ncbi:MAG: flagellar basal-body rod protein FlgF [Deltaproteobacteria bacterium]|nr:flagellar basal-body rod protein FlgF [Deltaproteobacteria bacterium]
MDQGIYTAASGAIAMEDRLAVISNNLANLNTSGFKKDRMSFEQFQKLLDTSTLYPGQYRTVPIDVITSSHSIDTSPGPCQKTGNPLDVSLVGDGFFVVNTENGPRYTRAGSFHLSPEGLMETAQGYAVQGEGGDIALDAGDVVIDSKGNINFNGSTVDTLQVVNIPPESLVREGNAMFAVKEGVSPEPLESVNVSQGFLEMANVDPVKEMVEMITTQRAYESFQKMIRSVNDAYSYSMRNVGTVA